MKVNIVVFEGIKVICPMIDNEPFVLVKTIIDKIGLNYTSAVRALNTNSRLS